MSEKRGLFDQLNKTSLAMAYRFISIEEIIHLFIGQKWIFITTPYLEDIS
jgi:hypothetical protein